jgi:hypothetical protein
MTGIQIPDLKRAYSGLQLSTLFFKASPSGLSEIPDCLLMGEFLGEQTFVAPRSLILSGDIRLVLTAACRANSYRSI